MVRLKSAAGEICNVMDDLRFEFPVLLRRRAALRSRRTIGYVSFRKTSINAVIIPACGVSAIGNSTLERRTHKNGKQPKDPSPSCSLC